MIRNTRSPRNLKKSGTRFFKKDSLNNNRDGEKRLRENAK